MEGQGSIWFLYSCMAYALTGSLAPLLFYKVTTIGLFFNIDLIIELDFKVFLADLIVPLVASINREGEGHEKFSKQIT